ncbi:MAG: SapC family protein [Magnetococcales bacterium]|nr:SapC family protein [Magnetococcales bacterium]
MNGQSPFREGRGRKSVDPTVLGPRQPEPPKPHRFPKAAGADPARIQQRNPMYRQPAVLNGNRHREWRLDLPEGDYGFAAGVNSLMVTGVEFALAAREYAIVFARGDAGQVVPVVMLGLSRGENLFLDGQGRWQGRYIPAYVRRYPFILAEDGDGKLAVCIDEASPAWNRERGAALFGEGGEQSELLKSAVRFLSEFQAQYLKTERFINRLQEMDLLTEWAARALLPSGEALSLGGVLCVDEKKLLALPEQEVLDLFRSGEMAWIYSHLTSLANLRELTLRKGCVSHG